MQCDDEHLFNAEEADERARNLLAAVTHIFFMDDDMTFPQDALMRLLAHDVPIVSGHYVKRFPPFWPVAMRYVGPTGYTSLIDFCPGLQEVDVVGGGCLLIKREVFETIPYPWFEYVSEEHKGVQTTEDVPFCEKAKKAGFPILLDFDVQCGHLVQIAASHEHWLQFREQMEEDGPPHDPEQLKIRRAAQDVRPYRPDRPKRRSRKSA
jgi:hypothetical protein